MPIKNKISIAFLGTPPFALPLLKKLHETWGIAFVVTAPEDEKKGKSPIHQYALKENIRVATPHKLTVDVFASNSFDLFVMAAYGKILKKEVLLIPKKGTLNTHPSLLPKYRGASPIQNAILDGEKETGITIILTDNEVDHGQIVAQEKISIAPDDDSVVLTEKLAHLGAELAGKTIPAYLEGRIKLREQNHAAATFTKPLKRDDGKIDWHEPAAKLERRIRAFKIWPGAWTEWQSMRIKILRASVENGNVSPPGTFLRTGEKNLVISTADGFLLAEDLQIEGRRPIRGSDFINGHGRELPLALTEKKEERRK